MTRQLSSPKNLYYNAAYFRNKFTSNLAYTLEYKRVKLYMELKNKNDDKLKKLSLKMLKFIFYITEVVTFLMN